MMTLYSSAYSGEENLESAMFQQIIVMELKYI